MDDQIIRLVADPAAAVAGAAKANAAIAGVEATGKKSAASVGAAAEQVAAGVVTVTQKSQTSIERMLASLEKRSKFAGASGMERLVMQQEADLRRVGGDPAAIKRVEDAYRKLMVVQKDVEGQSLKLGDALSNPLGAARGALDSFLGGFGKAGLAIAGGAAAAIAAAGAWWSMADAQMAAAEGMVNLSDRTGISIDNLDKLQAMAKIANVNLESIVMASRTLAAALEDESATGSKAQKAMAALKVSMFDAAGGERELGEVTLEVIQKLSRVANQSERVALATKLMGKGAAELQPLIKNYEALDKTAQQLGFGTREGLIKAMAEADDKMDAVGLRWDILKGKLMTPISAVVDVITRINDSFAGNTPEDQQRLAERNRSIQRREMADGGLMLSGGAAPGADWAGQWAGQTKGMDPLAADHRAQAFRNRLASNPEERIKALKEDLIDARKQAVGGVEGASDKYFGIAAEIKGIEKAIEKTKELQALREKALKYWREMRLLMSGGGLENSPLEVKLAKIDAVEGLGDRARYYAEQSKAARQFADETSQLQLETAERGLASEQLYIDRERDMKLAHLDGINARTVRDKLVVEQQKLGVMLEAGNREAALQVETIARRQEKEIAYLDWLAQIYPERQAEIEARRGAVIESYGQQAAETQAKWIGETAKLRETTEVQQQRIMADAWQRQFDSLKDGFKGLFAAALSGGKNWADGLKRAFLAIFLTPIEERLANWTAKLFMGGKSGAGTVGGSGGILGSLGGLFGGGGGAGSIPIPGMTGITGAGASTSGIAGSGAMGAGAMGGLGIGALGAGALGILGGYKAGQSDNKFLKYSAPGIWAFSGAIAASALMVMFPALVPFAPFVVGAGAVIGGIIGLVGALKKTSSQKMIEKVRSTYGITIDKSFAATLVDQAKQLFGGNIDAAIRAPQLRDAIMEYAMATDQRGKATQYDNRTFAGEIRQTGGSLYQAGSSVSGQAYGYQSSLTPVAGLRTYTESTATSVTLQLDGPTTERVLQGQAIQAMAANPATVQAAANRATSASAGRTTASINLTDPMGATI